MTSAPKKAAQIITIDLLALQEGMMTELGLGAFEARAMLLHHIMGYPPGFTNEDATGSHLLPVSSEDKRDRSLPPFDIGSVYRTMSKKLIPSMAVQAATHHGFSLDAKTGALLRGTALTAKTHGYKGKPVAFWNRTLFLDLTIKSDSGACGADAMARPAPYTLGVAAGVARGGARAGAGGGK
jgi:hypothetical protein